jgi:AP-1-like factor
MKVTEQAVSFMVPYVSSPSMTSSPDPNDNFDNNFQAISFEPPSTDEPGFMSQSSPLASTANQHNLKPTHSQEDSNCTFSADLCGLCGQDTPCFCREMALHEPAVDRTMVDQVSLRMDHFERNNPSQHSVQTMLSSKPSAQTSILDKLPAYQAPVPLRRRTTASNFNSVFPVSPPMTQHAAASSATCSGDPANCMACAEDSFGQAFCAAMGESIATIPVCDGCPCHSDTPNGNADSCGDPVESPGHSAPSASSSVEPPASGTIPTNDAWLQLKSHPNVAFADLSLLADVVARRSKCTGPQVIISPALGAVTPERVDSPPINHPLADPDHHTVPLTNLHAHYHENQLNGPSSRPRLVSQEVLIECGRQGVREVRTDAVREALRLLDTKFSKS